MLLIMNMLKVGCTETFKLLLNLYTFKKLTKKVVPKKSIKHILSTYRTNKKQMNVKSKLLNG